MQTLTLNPQPLPCAVNNLYNLVDRPGLRDPKLSFSHSPWPRPLTFTADSLHPRKVAITSV